MSKGVAITGMGIISAIGNTVAENYQSLITSQKGIDRISQIDTIHKNDIMVAEIDSDNATLEAKLGLPANNDYSRTTRHG